MTIIRVTYSWLSGIYQFGAWAMAEKSFLEKRVTDCITDQYIITTCTGYFPFSLLSPLSTVSSLLSNLGN